VGRLGQLVVHDLALGGVDADLVDDLAHAVDALGVLAGVPFLVEVVDGPAEHDAAVVGGDGEA
jgi:hypothetical protein